MIEQPVKQCRYCGRVFPYDMLVKHKECADGVRNQCKVCRNKYDKKWRDANPDKCREITERYRSNNKERFRINSRANARRYYHNNRSICLERQQQWRDTNVEKAKLCRQRWADRNHARTRQIGRLSSVRRRARERNLPSEYSVEQWVACREAFNDSCVYCGTTSEKLVMDHFIPLHAATCPGTVVDNIVPACDSCNSRKRYTLPTEWTIKTFGEERATEILSRIQYYFGGVSG